MYPKSGIQIYLPHHNMRFTMQLMEATHYKFTDRQTDRQTERERDTHT